MLPKKKREFCKAVSEAFELAKRNPIRRPFSNQSKLDYQMGNYYSNIKFGRQIEWIEIAEWRSGWRDSELS